MMLRKWKRKIQRPKIKQNNQTIQKIAVFKTIHGNIFKCLCGCMVFKITYPYKGDSDYALNCIQCGMYCGHKTNYAKMYLNKYINPERL